MGVPGLTTYVEGNTNFLQDLRFRDSRLVIDGSCLFFRLYLNYGLDHKHGGDYDSFVHLLIQFFSALATCNIEPYVVLDGGLDPSNKKLATLQTRLQNNIRRADNISHGRNGEVLPILIREVFIQVLNQRGIPLVQCPAEADWEIACLAHQWKCPVLSSDSDFYIFDMPGGYLPLSSFQWSHLNGKASHRYILTRIYTTKNFCRSFGGLHWELLPLFAVLNGNDYDSPKETNALVRLIEESTRQKSQSRKSTFRIEQILIWLSSFQNVSEALKEVNRLMGDGCGKDKKGLSLELMAAMREYHISPQSTLACWFSGDKEDLRRKTSGFAQLPEYLSMASAQGLLLPMATDALVMHKVLLIPQVENYKLASSHCTSRIIRQAVYGILLKKSRDEAAEVGGTQGSEMIGVRGRGRRGNGGRGQWHNATSGAAAASGIAQGFPTTVFVEEYDRLGLNVTKKKVEALSLRNHINLDALNHAPVAVRLDVLYEVLGVNDHSLGLVPCHLRLAVAVTQFWLREATPTPSELLLQALMLGMVYGELSLNDQHPHTAPQLNWAAEQNVRAALEKQRIKPWERGGGMDIGVAHSISQWQSCLWNAMCLNQLLLMPLLQPNLTWLYSGTLVHGLLRFLKGGRSAESLLPQGSLSAQTYLRLQDAVQTGSFKANPSSSVSVKKTKYRKQGSRGQGSDIKDMNNRFDLLMNDD